MQKWLSKQSYVNWSRTLNWGAAETWLYASLVEEGYPVRITGEDAGRGTFSSPFRTLQHMKKDGMYTACQHEPPIMHVLPLTHCCPGRSGV